MTDLELKLEFNDSGYGVDLNMAMALSGRRVPLWLGDTQHEILVTRVINDGGAPPHVTVQAHCAQELGELPKTAGSMFLGWRVQSVSER